MILWDTKKEGRRPDTMQLIRETWERFEAEVVFITSNRKGNDEIMQGCYMGMILFLNLCKVITNILKLIYQRLVPSGTFS